jgi:hypothetical protein
MAASRIITASVRSWASREFGKTAAVERLEELARL